MTTRTRIKVFGSSTYQDLENKMNTFLEETPGYLTSIKYATVEIQGKLECSALVRFEATA